ncbi:MAG: hypothetical protein N3I86_06590 [Verrucomicrobiae bacterium]|nr:hypothetical protein [Verrucomicrobiae bacterium]MDW8308852.1 hypothetical protein [Verrucomicrobiales bacterium]
MNPEPDPTTSETKTAALFVRQHTVVFEDGRSERLELKPLPLREYPHAFAALDDELALTGILAGRDRAWVETLTPASYEALYAELERLNARGFFAWSERQQARNALVQRRTLEALATLPPEALEAAARLGQASTSPTPLPTSSPKRA